VIPPIFASSIILFPATIAGWFTSDSTSAGWFIKDLAATLSPGQPIYVLLYAAAIVFFCFFYTALVFNSREGGQPEEERCLHSGHPSGRADARYIDKILVRLTLAGAIYITWSACCRNSWCCAGTFRSISAEPRC
jgi:preprotein translocase subunit SecY